MTENPAQGGSPENRGPEKPRDGWPAQPPHADTQPLDAAHRAQPQSAEKPAGDSDHDNPTVRLDQARSDNGQLHPGADGAPQPVYPQHQPFYGQQAGASTQHGAHGSGTYSGAGAPRPVAPIRPTSTTRAAFMPRTPRVPRSGKLPSGWEPWWPASLPPASWAAA